MCLAQQTLQVIVSNPLKTTRTDQPVIIALDGYGYVASALVTLDGDEVFCQLDDLDRDERMDELSKQHLRTPYRTAP